MLTSPAQHRNALGILFVTLVIDLLGFGIILPLLPVYVTHFGGTPVVAGLLSTSFSVMQFIFAPIWGRASDLYGRRPLILMSMLGTAICFLGFGLANSLWLLFAARIGAGILTAASIPTAQAYIADVTAPEKRTQGMALLGIAFGIGFAFGPWIGAVLGRHSLQLPAYFVSGLAFVNFLIALFMLPESHHPDKEKSEGRKIQFLDLKQFSNAFSHPELGELMTVFSVQTFAFSLLEATFTWLILLRFMHLLPGSTAHNAALETRAGPLVGSIFGTVGVAIFIVQGAMMSGLVQRIGERFLIRVGSAVLTLTMVGIGACTTVLQLRFLCVLVALGNGMLNPSLSSLVSKVADPRERGGVLGIQQGLGSFARIIGPLLGTWMLSWTLLTPYGAPYYVAAILMFLAFCLSMKLKRLDSAGPQEPPEEDTIPEALAVHS